MKIFIDIGHPAHVHYFRNFIKIMENRGHKFFVTARDKEVTHQLLDYYNIKYHSRGKGRKGYIGKTLYIFEADYKLLKYARQFKPDLFLSFGSAYAAHVSKILGKPHIAFDDTEHAKYEHIMYVPFTDIILTPTCFEKNFGKKQIKFHGYMELCYLHPKYFKPDKSIKELLSIDKNNKYVLLRFISWEASHDLGAKKINFETKMNLIRELNKYAKVFISSENDLSNELNTYKLPVSPEKFHDVLYYATLYIGEGATTASECVALGTPSIYINSLDTGYLKEQTKYNLLIKKLNIEEVIDEAINLIKKDDLKEEWQKRRQKMLSEKIDVTAFIVWFVENYPESYRTMKENPDYQYNFM